MRVAAVNYLLSPQGLVSHYRDVLERCALSHVDLAVLPENTSFELLFGEPSTDQLMELRDFLTMFSRETSMTIIAGTHLIEGENVAWQVAGGFIVPQTKNKMTTYEREEFRLTPGSSLSPITKDIGTLICYDSEFPEAGRALAESGRTIICVPAFTETEHGFWRVRNSCLARAIENQVFVIHSSLVGSLGKEPVPTAVGSSAIIAPSIEPYPAGGILAETEWNQEGIAIADISIDELLEARTKGDVRNWEDRTPDCWTVR